MKYNHYTHLQVTASDEHFLSASQGTIGQTILPISVSVTDNVHPTINNQTLSSISENSSNGEVVATISTTDNEGDTITFSDFTLYKLELDDVKCFKCIIWWYISK